MSIQRLLTVFETLKTLFHEKTPGTQKQKGK